MMLSSKYKIQINFPCVSVSVLCLSSGFPRKNKKTMSDFEHFLNEVTDANILAKIARDITGEYDDDDENAEAEGPKEQKKKNDKSFPSPTLKRVVQTYRPYDSKDPCKTAWGCTVLFFKEALEDGELDFGLEDGINDIGMNKLEKVFKQMRALTGAARLSSTSALTGALGKWTSMLKKHWVPRGFSDNDRDIAKSPIGLAKEILVRTQGEAYAERSRGDRARLDKLSDSFIEKWSNIQRVATRWAQNKEGGKTEAVQKLMSAELSAGMRKTAVLDANVQFYTLEQWEKLTGDSVEDGFYFGTEDRQLPADLKAWQKLVGPGHIIVQHGKLKDKDQAINKYLLKGDSRFVENTVVFKPTLIFTADKIVKLVAEVRKHFKLTKPTTLSREKLGANVGTRDYKDLLTEAFPASAAKAAARKWSFGTHIARKIYVNAAVDIYKDQIRIVTGNKRANRGILMQTFLSHEGSLGTFLSYANMVINFDDKIKEKFSLPPDHLVRLFTHDLERLREENIEMKAQMAAMTQMFKMSIAQPAKITTTLQLPQKKGDKTVTTVVIGNLRQFRGSAKAKYIAGVRLLEKNGLTTSTKNLKGLGLGNSTISNWRKYYKVHPFPDEKEPEEVADAAATLDEKEEKVTDVAADDGDLGYKVIVPAMPDPVPRSDFDKSSQGTKRHKAAAKVERTTHQEETRRKDVWSSQRCYQRGVWRHHSEESETGQRTNSRHL